DDPAERCVATGDALGEGHDVRLQIPLLGGAPVADPAEPGDHRVADVQPAGRADGRPARLEVVLAHRAEATGTDHGLHEDAGDAVGAGVLDGLLHGLGVVVGDVDDVTHQLAAVVDPVRLHATELGAVGVHPVIRPFPGDEH